MRKPEPKPRVELCGMRGGIDTSEPFLTCEQCTTPDICYGLEGCGRELDREAGFAPEDYAYTAKLLRQHNADAATKLFQAVCSNNLNIILAALDALADEP